MKPFAIFLYLLIFSSCSDDDQDTSSSCDADLVCTLELRSISLEIVNSEGAPISLDSTKVTNKTTNETFVGSNELSSGRYTIINDEEFDNVEQDGTLFQFEGFIDGERALSQEFLIGHDCCHVLLLEGPEKTVIP